MTARLIGHHSHYEFIPREVNFHADPKGVPGLLAGTQTVDGFVERLEGYFRYRHHSGGERGLHGLVDEARFARVVDAFREDAEHDLAGACRRLMHAILDPIAEAAKKPSWVEMTPRNAVATSTLARVFPDARIVHSVRDGRDVAADKVRRGMKVPDVFAALDWWAKKILRASRQIPLAGADRVLVIRLEDLVANAREETYARLLEFLGVADDPGMRAYFDGTVRESAAGIGSWRRIVPPEEHERFNARYREVVASLLDRDVPFVSLPDGEPRSRPAAAQAAAPPRDGDELQAEPGRIVLADPAATDAGEIEVAIRGDGRLVLLAGAERLAAARRAGTPKVAVRVVHRAPEWLAFRDEVLAYAAARRSRVYQTIDHPDLVALPAYHGVERFEILRDALSDYPAEGKRLLDIGAHWGYMSQQMERLGFRCTAVEASDECIRFATRLRVATESHYDIWHGSIFDFPDAEEQDVVVALNIFNHLIKTPELHERLVTFLKRLRADVILFEPHLAHQPGKMTGAYRNYAPDEFAEFVAANAGMSEIVFLGHEPDHYSRWKRPLYKIVR